MTIHTRLDELMRARGLTAKQLSELTGITEAAISEWRNNKVRRYSLDTIDTLCKFFNIQPGDLIVRVESAPPDSPVPQVAE